MIFKFKLVISLHGDEVRRVKELRKKSLRFILYNYLFKSSNFITGCSNHLLTQHLLNFKQNHKKSLITINNGVNNNFIDQTLNEEKKNYVFTASRFVPDKGLDLLRVITPESLAVARMEFNASQSSLANMAPAFEIPKTWIISSS